MSLVHDAAAAALRRLNPETAHRLSLRALKAGLGPRDGAIDDPALALRVAGMDLPNVIGLAAGYDKDAEAADALLKLGFGFVECGTVTPAPQPGNPRPRLFRLAPDRAVINRFGFNSEGVEAFADRLARRRRRGVLGANLGTNKDSADRIGDYVAGLERLWGLSDYFTVNVSSPNTAGLRDLQSRSALQELAGRLAEARARLKGDGPDHPLFLKVAPDLADRDVVDIVETVHANGLEGVVVANTTLSRPPELISAQAGEAGGLSGAPLRALTLQMVRRFYEAGRDRGIEIIGVGGVASGADAYALIRAGACAVQLYTALVYEGPGLVRRIKRDLAARLRADGLTSVYDARGAG